MLLYCLDDCHCNFVKCISCNRYHNDFFIFCGNVLRQAHIINRRKHNAQCDQQYAGAFHHKQFRIIRRGFVMIASTQYRRKPHRR